MIFKLTAVVERDVTDEIDMEVEAPDEAEAYRRAYAVLSGFPEGHEEDETWVPKMLISIRHYGGSEIIDIADTEEEPA